MKKILFVDMHREGRSPSQRFRYEQYLNILVDHGFLVDHSYLLNETDDSVFYKKGKYLAKSWILFKSIARRFYDLSRSNKYDYIFVQREAFMLGTAFFEVAFSKTKAKLIYDFDDSIWLNQISISAPNKKLNFLKNPSKTAQIIKVADLVVVGNQFLANYAKQINHNVKIIPTTIDTNLYLPTEKKASDKVTIGWSGSSTTIDHFLGSIPVLEKLRTLYQDKIEFVVIGDRTFKHSKLEITGKAWNKLTEVVDLQNFDIGIMPLPDDEWSKGKCGLKGLQYMALGIPTVMSAVGVNANIIQHGENGYLASTEEEWVNCLQNLIDDEELRKRLGQNGRNTVINKYSTESQVATFLSLFE